MLWKIRERVAWISVVRALTLRRVEIDGLCPFGMRRRL
jgi:hypothetical protein